MLTNDIKIITKKTAYNWGIPVFLISENCITILGLVRYLLLKIFFFCPATKATKIFVLIKSIITAHHHFIDFLA